MVLKIGTAAVEVLAYLTGALTYDAATGVLTWVTPKAGQIEVGTIAGWSGKKYDYVTIGNRSFPAHRIAWLLTHGRWPMACLDHINGDRRDNRLANLREASPTQNQWNRRGRRNSISGLKGACAVPRKRGVCFAAIIKIHGQSHNLGVFDTAAEAHAVYCAAAAKAFGKFARFA